MMLTLLAVLSLIIFKSNAEVLPEPGKPVTPTQGEVWPKPQQQEKYSGRFLLKPNTFRFKAPQHIECPNILNDALKRYYKIIANTGTAIINKQFHLSTPKRHSYLDYITFLKIELTEDCLNDDILPAFGDDESYTLTVTSEKKLLSAKSIWGVLRGLETFSQLFYKMDDDLWIDATQIYDFPRFPHRGLLVDTSRHFFPVQILLDILDAMSYNKMNVFHWHIIDDQSFPYQSRAFPELSEYGAYNPLFIYDQEDVKTVIEYARLRGIRVIPEFDMPGQSKSWGASHPEFLSYCYNEKGHLTGELGPVDPSGTHIYEFLKTFLQEIIQTFPDNYIHLGGDEVYFACWQYNPKISAFMKEKRIKDHVHLESYFVQKIVNLVTDLGNKHIVWEEVFVNGVKIPDTTIVQMWKANNFDVLKKVVASGKYAIFSSCWYLDVLDSTGDWQKFYKCDPRNFTASEEELERVIGGEACMWTEVVNEYNIISRIWPRASAAAEKLWSAGDVNDIEDAKHRLEEHYCRLIKRGIGAQPPNGPGVCL